METKDLTESGKGTPSDHTPEPRYEYFCSIMIGRHFHANIKVQTAMCKDNYNSKNRVATYLKFDIYIK